MKTDLQIFSVLKLRTVSQNGRLKNIIFLMQANKIQQLAESNTKNLEFQLIFQSKIVIQFKIIESWNGLI